MNNKQLFCVALFVTVTRLYLCFVYKPKGRANICSGCCNRMKTTTFQHTYEKYYFFLGPSQSGEDGENIFDYCSIQ
jgi:hypothetical protein